MSAQLRGLLADIADQAPNYADPQRALAEARRRRHRRRTVVPIVAFIAVAVLVAVPVLTADDPPAPPVATGTPSPDVPSVDVAGYPRRVVPPPVAQRLPEGPLSPAAAFLYAPCARDCDPYLVMSDGRQYALELPDLVQTVAGYTLSPDGTWLGYSTTHGFELLHIPSGLWWTLPEFVGPGITEAWAWSPDSTRLLLANHVEGVIDHFVLVQLSGDQPQHLIRLERDQIPGTAYGVRNDGDIVVRVADVGGELPTLAIVDSDTRTERTRFMLQMPPNSQLLREGETLELGVFFLGPSDDAGLVVIGANDALSVLRETGFVGVDLAAGGHIVGRNDLPVPEIRVHQADEVWHVVANLRDGVLLIHRMSDRTEIVQMNDVTGERTVATTLPVDSQVVVRGGARFSA